MIRFLSGLLVVSFILCAFVLASYLTEITISSFESHTVIVEPKVVSGSKIRKNSEVIWSSDGHAYIIPRGEK